MLSRQRNSSSRTTPDSKPQKLFNLLVSQYLNSSTDIIEPFPLSDDLLPFVNSVNAFAFLGTNYITFDPERVFSASDLIKLKNYKTNLVQTRTEIASLKNKLDLEQDKEIISAHKTYMDRLHRYNEAKDMAQALIGKLAQLTGKTTKDLYPDFNLSLDD